MRTRGAWLRTLKQLAKQLLKHLVSFLLFGLLSPCWQNLALPRITSFGMFAGMHNMMLHTSVTLHRVCVLCNAVDAYPCRGSSACATIYPLLPSHTYKLQFISVITTVAVYTAQVPADSGAEGSQDVAAAAQNLQKLLDHGTESLNSNQESSQRRAHVKDLFRAMDKDDDGKLDVGEFRGICRTATSPPISTYGTA